jgi:uncharacterized protein (TIGR00156 family)
MKKAPLMLLLFLLSTQSVYAQEPGGLKENVAPPPPHKIEDGYRGTDDARVMTVKFAKTMYDGATLPYGATSSSITVTIATFSATKRTLLTSSSRKPF